MLSGCRRDVSIIHKATIYLTLRWVIKLLMIFLNTGSQLIYIHGNIKDTLEKYIRS